MQSIRAKCFTVPLPLNQPILSTYKRYALAYRAARTGTGSKLWRGVSLTVFLQNELCSILSPVFSLQIQPRSRPHYQLCNPFELDT